MGRRGIQRAKATTVVSCLLILFLCVNLPVATSPLGAGISTASAASGGSPIFSITLIIPGDDPVKLVMSQLISVNLGQLGIDCQVVALDYTQISQRVLSPSLSLRGMSFANGGFDAILLGRQLPASPDPYLLYDSTQFVPYGLNYYLWNDTTNNLLCSSIRGDVNATDRIQLDRNWQSYAMDWLPSTAILYANGTVALNRYLDASTFESLAYPIWPAVERWSGNLSALGYSIVLAQPRNASNLMPLFSSSYYDAAVMNPIFGPAGFGLFQLKDMLSTREYVPCMAQSFNASVSDPRNLTIVVRNDVRFQDGVKLTAKDVNFTLHAYMAPVLGSPLYPLFRSVFGSNSSVYIGPDNYTLEVRLPKPYAYIMDLLSLPVLPEHVLGNSSNLPYDKWRASPFNTGKPSTTPTYYWINGTRVELKGPIGAGPYKYSSYNETTRTYYLQKFSNYFNASALEMKGLFNASSYQVKVIDTGLGALQALQSGAVNILDMQYHLELLGSYLNDYIGSGVLVTFKSLSVQEMGFNMQHPILGTGIGTPVGATNATNAADAARHVRKAIALAIPRDQIIQQQLYGYGSPGRTSAFCPLSEGYDPSITSYALNLTKAADELRAAGYQPSPLTSGFLESYGTAILLIGVAVVIVVSIIVIKKTSLVSKLRKQTVVK
ncbi:MAG: ABC transporter substrate-binding protein [Promethearchaeati archaeon SRVP18_Atabeyarchaeia-1]